MDKYEKLLETLKSDKQFAEELFSLEPADAAQKLQAKGFDFDKDELVKIAKDVATLKESIGNNDQISDEDLEKVAGGKSNGPGAGYYGFVGGLLVVLGVVSIPIW